MDNEFKLEFKSKSINEGFARIVVASFVSQLDPIIEELSDIKIAVSEAVTNSIIHGYKELEGIIKINCKLIENKVHIEVIDSGCGIENVEEAKKMLFTSLVTKERSGMGFTIMENFMDKVIIESIVGVGTKVIMEKELSLENT